MGSKAAGRKVVIVTGSTSGIGETVARHLHARGYNVALTGRRTKEGEANAASLDSSGETAIFIASDVSSYASQSQLFRAVWDRWGRLDALVANAGCVDRDSKYNLRRRDAPVDELPPEPDTTCTDVDWKGVVYGTTLATHFMRHNPGAAGGKIVITGSMIALQPCPTFPEYCAVKAAVLQWTRTMAPLLKSKENIALNVVLPNGVDTDAMPGFSTAFLPEHLTRENTLLSGFDLFLENDERNERFGLAVETGHNALFFHKTPKNESGAIAERSGAVYEPWFELIHGEKSGLEGALTKPPGK